MNLVVLQVHGPSIDRGEPGMEATLRICTVVVMSVKESDSVLHNSDATLGNVKLVPMGDYLYKDKS